MTWDHHYSDHLSHYVSSRPGIEPGLMACQASMLPTRPPGRIKTCKKHYGSKRGVCCYRDKYEGQHSCNKNAFKEVLWLRERESNPKISLFIFIQRIHVLQLLMSMATNDYAIFGSPFAYNEENYKESTPICVMVEITIS